MVYENYKERVETWANYFTLIGIKQAESGLGRNLEGKIKQYLPPEGPNIELMLEDLKETYCLKEKSYLILLIKEFNDFLFVDLELEDIDVVNRSDRIHKAEV